MNKYYEILELEPGASLEEVKQAYKDLAFVWHPDKYLHNIRLQKKAEKKLQEINEAYEILCSHLTNPQNEIYLPKQLDDNEDDDFCNKYYYETEYYSGEDEYNQLDDEDDDFCNKYYYEPEYYSSEDEHNQLDDEDDDFCNKYYYEPEYYSGEDKYNQLDDEDDDFCNKYYYEPEYYSGEDEYNQYSQSLPSISLISSVGINYSKLRDLLESRMWKEADEETANLMLKAVYRTQQGSLRIEDIKKFPCKDLSTIDQLWTAYSDEHFGFSLQKQIWSNSGGDPSRFCGAIGWQWLGIWRDYPNLPFTLKSKKGQLPTLFLRKGKIFGLGGMTDDTEVAVKNKLPALIMRLVECKI